MSIPSVVEGLLFSTVLLPCDADGIPTPVIQWVKEGKSLDASTSYSVLANGTLLIRNLSMSDEGLYRCIASNRGGTDNRTVALDVHCMFNTSWSFISL